MKEKSTRKTLKVAAATVGVATMVLLPTGCATAAGGAGGGGVIGGSSGGLLGGITGALGL